MADTAVSKTAGGQLSCRVESDLRHHPLPVLHRVGYTTGKRMHIFSVVLQSVLVLLGIGFVGLWITRRRILPENVISVLSTLVIDIALPATVFASIIINFNPGDFPDWWQLPLWWLGFTVIAFVLTLLSRFVAGKEVRPEWGVTMFFQNGLFFPLIILTGLLGATGPLIARPRHDIIIPPDPSFLQDQFFFKKEP